MPLSLKEINYRAHPELFSNRCLVDMILFDELGDVLEGNTEIGASELLTLQVLSEAVVFHEKIIIHDEGISGGAQLAEGGRTSACLELVRALGRGNIFESELISMSSYGILQDEANILSLPSAENVRVNLIHGSHIIIDEAQSKFFVIPTHEFSSKNLLPRITQAWSKAYIKALQDYDYYWETDPGFVPPPWKLLADCHGIPYFSDPFYALRDIDLKTPTNIGIDLYRKLEDLNKEYFIKIKKYLGPTYVYVPPILNLVLNECNKPEDIPTALIHLREQFQDFRSACTSLEMELRKSKSFTNQVEIIREIESVYTSLRIKVEKTKTRLLLRLFDVIKEVDPLHMGMEVLNQVKNYIVEEEGLIKMPGYFDIWKATSNIKPGISNVYKVFGNQVSSMIIEELEDMNQTILSQGIPMKIDA